MAIAGKVAPTYDGDWSADKSYQQHTYVRYNGDAYISIKASVGIEPTNEEYWFLALKNASQEQLDALNNRIDSIQTTSSGTLSEAGWYRVAEYKGVDNNALLGSRSNSCEIIIKRGYGTNPNEEHKLLLNSLYNKQTFDKVKCYSYSDSYHYITKVRYTKDTSAVKAYIEIYYNANTANDVFAIINDGADFARTWQAITPTLTAEAVEGVTVTTTYDIPSNASPVTNLDLETHVFTRLTDVGSDEELNTLLNNLHNSVPNGASYERSAFLSYANSKIGGGKKRVIGFRQTDTYGWQVVNGWERTKGKSEMARSIVGGTWGEWVKNTTEADLATELAKYLPKTGGDLTGNIRQILGNADVSHRMKNNARDIEIYVDANGLLRFMDNTNSTPIFTSTVDGANSFKGTATGNLALDGSNFMKAGVHLKDDLGLVSADGNRAFMESYNVASDNTVARRLMLCNSNYTDVKRALRLRDVADGSYVEYDLLHTGNSAAVAVSNTAPSDTSALWIDYVNKTIKYYSGGAWNDILSSYLSMNMNSVTHIIGDEIYLEPFLLTYTAKPIVLDNTFITATDNEDMYADLLTEGLRIGSDVDNIQSHYYLNEFYTNDISYMITLNSSRPSNTDLSYIFATTFLGCYDNTTGKTADGTVMLGTMNYRWKEVYAASPSIVTSDRNEKMDICGLEETRAKDFIMSLKPSSFKFIENTSNRTHYGLIAQDVEEAMNKLGMSSLDFAGFIKSPKTETVYEDEFYINKDGEKATRKRRTEKEIEGEYRYSLRYEEFIAPLIKVVQTQQTEIDSLKEQIDELKNLIKSL